VRWFSALAALVPFCLILLSPAQSEPPERSAVEFRLEFGEHALSKDLHQLALWLETPEGEFLDTVYVTGKVGKQGLGNGYMKVGRLTVREAPDSLPVWAHARGVRYGESYYPPKDHPLPDAITGATPKAKEFTRTFALLPELRQKLHGAQVVCAAELNVSRLGGASLIFKGTLDLAKAEPVPLLFVGTGDPKGATGKITPDTKGRHRPGAYLAGGSVSLVE